MKEQVLQKDPSILDVNNVKAAVLGISLSYRAEDTDPKSKFNIFKEELKAQLQSQNEFLEKITPFYKDGDNKNQAGYIIETNKKIMLCYHGTQLDKFSTSGKKEVLHDLQIQKAKMKFGNEEGGVHAGFKKEYDASKKDMLEKLKIACSNNNKKILCTGHSLGGSTSQIAALDLASNHPAFKDKIETVITFGSPRVFYKTAAKIYNNFNLNNKTLRVEQKLDIVPKLVPKGLYADTGFAIKLHAKPGNYLYTQTHSTEVYRNIADGLKQTNTNKIKEEHLKPSSIPITIEEYCKSVIELTQKQFLELFKSIQNSIKNKTFVQNHAAPFLKKRSTSKAFRSKIK